MIDLSMLPDFIAEASEHLEEMESDLLRLEGDLGNRDVLNDIFRAAHTIKGSAEYLGMEKIAELSHKLENLLDMLRHGERTANREIVDTLIESRDRMAMLTEDLERFQAEKTDTQDILERIDRLSANPPEAASVPEPKKASVSTDDAADALILSDTPQTESLGTCERPETIDMDAVQKCYEELKLVLYKMTHGDLSDENRDRVLLLLENFISISGCMGDDSLMSNLSSMRRQAALLAFPDDAGDMLADLHRFMNSLVPQSYAPPRDDTLAASDHDIAPDHPVFPDTIDEDLLFEDSEDDDISDKAKEDGTEENLFLGNATEEDDFLSDADEIKKDGTEENLFLGNATEEDDFLADIPDDAEELTFEEKAVSETGADKRITLAADDIYDDEYDDELFDIFIQHLKENISFIKSQTEHLRHSEDKGEELGKCLGYLNSLQSSANYMDYRNLTEFYEKWILEIENIRERLFPGEEIAFASPEGVKSDVASGMMAYVSEVVKRFPQAVDSDPESTDALADEAEETAAEVSSPPVQDIPEAEAEDILASDIPESPAPEDLEIPDESTETEDIRDDLFSDDMGEFEAADTDIPSKEIPQEAHAEADDDADAGYHGPSADYQGLFGELDDAFDSLADDLDSEPDPDPEEVSEDLEEKLAAPATEGPSSPRVSEATDERTGASDWEAVSEAIQGRSDLPEIPIVPETLEPRPEEESEILTPPEHAEPGPEQSSEILAPPPEPADEPGTEVIAAEAPDATEPEHLSEKFVKKQTLRVDARKIDSLMNQVGELVVSRAWFSQLYSEMRELQQHLHETVKLDQREMKPVRSLTFKLSEATVALGRVANELQEGVMKVRMLPIAQLFNRYPRLVRDLTHDTDKTVRLDIVGEETELDKMVIEEISDPLIHIIRNAVDHGCEAAEERRELGKKEGCTLRLEAYHESNHVVIEISDDGRGISPDLVRQKALEKNFFSQDELDRMGHRDIMGIIMKPGFSTADTVSKTSGRGVGMDVVKKNIEKLNGTIEIDSKTGMGTRFRIKIPLTLAIIQALLVRVGNDIFTIPLSTVEETLRVFEEDISIIEGVEVIHLRDSTLSLLRLSEIFGIESKAQDTSKAFVVIVNTGMREVGLVVDSLIGQEEAVIKPLVDYLQESSGFSGATILGDGRISLILDVYELVNLSIGRRARKKADMAALEMTEFPNPNMYEHRTLH